MPLKFINLCNDFVLFFASSPMRSRNSSTVAFVITPEPFGCSILCEFSVTPLQEHPHGSVPFKNWKFACELLHATLWCI